MELVATHQLYFLMKWLGSTESLLRQCRGLTNCPSAYILPEDSKFIVLFIIRLLFLVQKTMTGRSHVRGEGLCTVLFVFPSIHLHFCIELCLSDHLSREQRRASFMIMKNYVINLQMHTFQDLLLHTCRECAEKQQRCLDAFLLACPIVFMSRCLHTGDGSV